MSGGNEFKPVSFLHWITGCMCWETKGGFLLILAGGLLLWFTDLKIPFSQLQLGYGVLILGALIQAAGLGRDCRIIYKNRKKNHS